MTSETQITIMTALQCMIDDTAKRRDNARLQLATTGDIRWQESIDYWEKSNERYLSAYNAIK